MALTVAQLIVRLQALPQDAPVHISKRGGCSECNPDGVDYYVECDGAEFSQTAYVDGYGRDPISAVIL